MFAPIIQSRRPRRFTDGARALTLFLLSVCAVTVRAADGDFRWAYKLDSSSRAPTTESSPAVDAQGTVYLGYSWGDALNAFGSVVAITPTSDGKAVQKWSVAATDNVEAAPTLAPDGSLYIGDMAGVVFAVDKNTGTEKWRYDTAAAVSGLPYVHSTIALSADASTLYVGVGTWDLGTGSSGGALLALSRTGQLLWAKHLAATVESSPVVAREGEIYVGAWDGTFYAFNPDGSEKWRRTLGGNIQGSPALAGDGTIYVGTRGNQFVAITPDNQVRWSREMIVLGSPAVGPDGIIYVGNYADFTFNALNWSDGSTKWKASGTSMSNRRGVSAAVRTDGTVIYGGLDSTLRAYRAVDGSLLWSSGSNTYGPLDTTPAVSPGVDHAIYVASYTGTFNSATLYAFSGNQYGLSAYASWPTFQHDVSHTGIGPEAIGGGRLMNLATRGQVTPTHPLIGGFVPTGKGVKPLLLRAVGPTLADYHVNEALTDPRLVLRITGGAVPPTTNENWGDGGADALAQAFAATGAFPLPDGSKDAAMLLSAINLAPYNYTATVESADGGSGVALFEVYDMDPLNQSTHLANLSTRGHVGTGANVLIAGLVVGGPGRQRVLVRAVGPGLAPYKVTDYLQQPQITVYNGKSQIIDANNGWKTGPWHDDMPIVASSIGAFPLADNDSALILALDPGNYTFIVSGVGGSVGEALVEVYALPF